MADDKPRGNTEMERMVWAAAFSAEWAREWNFRQSHSSTQGGWRDPQSISGFSCAEIADCALEAYRESMTCDDAEYLIPGKEDWDERGRSSPPNSFPAKVSPTNSLSSSPVTGSRSKR
jgi:hypothetical protein